MIFLSISTIGYAQHNSTGTTPLEIRRNSSGGESLKIGIGDRTGLLEYVQDYDEGSGTHDLSFNISSSISHFYSWRSNGSELFRINSSGNFGIGTTNPDVNLEIRRDLNNAGVNLFNDNSGLKITNHDLTNGSYSSLKLETRGDGDGAYIRGINQGNNNVNLSIGKYQSGSGGVSVDWLTILNNGNIGIGASDPQSKLAVEGQIRATEVKVLADISVPDYVFESDYELRTLQETKDYITENKHLPEIPSASEIGENGIDLGDMNMRLLKKIEELTLHLIEQNERMEKLEKEMSTLKNK